MISPDLLDVYMYNANEIKPSHEKIIISPNDLQYWSSLLHKENGKSSNLFSYSSLYIT